MRTATVHDIARLIEQETPPSLAETWDNVGLQVGDGDWSVRKIWVALDATRTVIDKAVKSRIDMLITHHPLLFRPLKTLDLATPIGHILEKTVRHRLAVYSAHTNLDRVKGGVNDILADRLGLRDPVIMDAEQNGEKGGFSRMGILDTPRLLKAYVKMLKKNLGLSHIRFSGDPKMAIHKVALCAGSGSGLLDVFLGSDADVFVSGDLKYHDARRIQDYGRGLIDIGHFHSEYLFIEVWMGRLQESIHRNDFDVIVQHCPMETDPFTVL